MSCFLETIVQPSCNLKIWREVQSKVLFDFRNDPNFPFQRKARQVGQGRNTEARAHLSILYMIYSIQENNF